MSIEIILEEYACRKARKLGGTSRKCKWIMHNGAPDRLFLLDGYAFFIEFKKKDVKPDLHQIEEAKVLSSAGLSVYFADSEALVDWIFATEAQKFKQREQRDD